VSVVPFLEEMRLPLRVLSGSTIRLAGWAEHREWAEPGLRGNSKVPAEPVHGGFRCGVVW
jgi:hypothetical protein